MVERLIAGTVVLTALMSSPLCAGEVEELLESLEANEALYDNCRIVYSITSDQDGRGLGEPENRQLHETEGEYLTVGGQERSQRFVTKYDLAADRNLPGNTELFVNNGEEGRFLRTDPRPSGVVQRGLYAHDVSIRPHTLVMGGPRRELPLSVYIRGRAAIEAYGGDLAGTDAVITGIEEDQIGDLVC